MFDLPEIDGASSFIRDLFFGAVQVASSAGDGYCVWRVCCVCV